MSSQDGMKPKVPMSHKVALYANGLFSHADSAGNQQQLTQLQSAGFNTVILWAMHVHENGDFYYNDTLMISNGEVSSEINPHLGTLLTELKASGVVDTILFSIGGWGVGDFANITELLNSSSGRVTFYKNIQALQGFLPIDGFDFDMEESYGQSMQRTITNLSVDLTTRYNCTITYCPYQEPDFWLACLQNVFSQVGHQTVSQYNLQCYAGGTGNNPDTWASAIQNGNCGVVDGASFMSSGWDAGSAPQGICKSLNQFHCQGGFVWNLSEIDSSDHTAANYAQAVENGLSHNC